MSKKNRSSRHSERQAMKRSVESYIRRQEGRDNPYMLEGYRKNVENRRDGK